jgi:hypothetical protein
VQFSVGGVSEMVGDTRKDAMVRQPFNSSARLSGSMRKLGAYAAVALLVPGGSIIAFVMWASQHRGLFTPRAWRAVFTLLALGTGLIVPG